MDTETAVQYVRMLTNYTDEDIRTRLAANEDPEQMVRVYMGLPPTQPNNTCCKTPIDWFRVVYPDVKRGRKDIIENIEKCRQKEQMEHAVRVMHRARGKENDECGDQS